MAELEYARDQPDQAGSLGLGEVVDAEPGASEHRQVSRIARRGEHQTLLGMLGERGGATQEGPSDARRDRHRVLKRDRRNRLCLVRELEQGERIAGGRAVQVLDRLGRDGAQQHAGLLAVEAFKLQHGQA